ncbi:hypothetical protein [Kineococcus aurantiacus]|uniref:Glycerophosphoryl diester phosphodiesterase membrane domain-containing protein n=1 Tax=Kineococcus aurantiacus TaxID=37633 RepID=A0A7Y9DMV8_9ACTN|nr:hypothetical protein [Kineococcus aurantiacus]NYD23520.1 hypothetical protein [Kineococcus aurantiacus]
MGTDQWQRPDDQDPAPPAPAAAPSGWGAPAGGPPPQHAAPAAPRPGIVPLRPLGLGEIWDGAFRAFRQNPRVMVGLSAIVVALTSVVTLLATVLFTRDVVGLATSLEAGTGSVEDVFSTVQSSLPLLVLSGLLQTLAVLVLNGMLIYSVSQAVLGRTTTFGQLWAACRSRLLPLIGLSLVITLASVLLWVVLLAPGALLLVFAESGTGTAAGVAAVLVGTLAALAGWAFVWVKSSMASPAMLLEQLGVVAALKRSFGLTRRSFWRLFGIQLLTLIVVQFAVGAVSVPFAAVGGAVGAATGSTGTGSIVVQNAIQTVGQMAGSIVAYPFLASVTALLYVDLRMRREGLDVELHRASAR